MKYQRTSLLMIIVISLLFAGCGVDFRLKEPAVPAIGQGGISEGVDNQNRGQSPEEKPSEPPTPPPPVDITIQAVGDIMMHMPQIKAGYIGEGKYDFLPVYKYVQPIFEKGDLVIGNLETTFGGPERGYSGYPMFSSPDALAQNLKAAGFDLMVTANNHSLDTGAKGLRRTLTVLEEAGLNHTGTFAEEQTQPLLVDIKGVKVGIANYTYGTNGLKPPQGQEHIVNYLNKERFIADIAFLKEAKVDYIIGFLHFGNEYQLKPSDLQKEWVNFAFEQGVDLVLGSHPHVLQPFQVNEQGGKSRVVAYSLGNFVSNQRDPYRDTGVIFQVNLQKDFMEGEVKFVGVETIPTWVHKYRSNGKLYYTILPLGEDYWEQYKGYLEEEALHRANQAYEEAKEVLHQPVE